MCKISWLEDEGYFVHKLMRFIKDKGHKVYTFETMVEAQNNFEVFETSDLIIVDLIVSKDDIENDTGIDDEYERFYGGLALMRKISNLPNPPPMLVLSVVVTQDILNKARQYTDHIMTKPVRITDFTNKVLSLLPENKSSPNHD